MITVTVIPVARANISGKYVRLFPRVNARDITSHKDLLLEMSTTTTTVLGKRRIRTEKLVLRLSSSPEPWELLEPLVQRKSEPILLNDAPIPSAKKYRCVNDGCGKSYTKPSRLAEHERSHTGEVNW
jgi:hypothetical protein